MPRCTDKESDMTMPLIATRRPWHQRALDWAREHFGHHASALRGLDRRALADIGVHPSEIDSIEAEAHGQARMTRLRIVVGAHHA
jgi:uncharacterized protein YjiS (DUF1127 family)